MSTNAVEMIGICKTFGETVALNSVDISIGTGEIHAILGENGAGKTTLMKILYGMTKMDKGTIKVYGQEVKINNTMDAIKLGIGMVHQHFMLADIFSVMENVVVGAEPSQKQIINKKFYENSVMEINNKLNFNLDINKKVEDLSVGQKQRVEIMKALYRGAQILILDEPTAVLIPQEVKEFFDMLRILKEEGKSVILITHKLHEIIDVADRVTILRDGKYIAQRDAHNINERELAHLMVGRDIEIGRLYPPKEGTETLFEVKNLNCKNEMGCSLHDINLTVNKNEIVGIAGVDGNGQTELIEAITGITKPDTMEVYLNGNRVSGGSKDFINAKIGHIPEDRNKRGLVGEMSIQDNLILGYHKKSQFEKFGILKQNNIIDYSKKVIKDFSIKAFGPKELTASLSGGNAQKVVVGRVFSQKPEIVIAAQPTRGVDISATEYIHNRMIELRNSGKGVLLISADLNEVLKLSDRIAVMFDGHIVAIDRADAFTEEELGMLMTSGKITEKEANSGV